MKLNLFFILMDLAILAAYPVVFVLGKLRQLSRIMENKTPTNPIASNVRSLDG